MHTRHQLKQASQPDPFFLRLGHPCQGRQGRRGGWRRQAAVFTHQLPIVHSFLPIVIPWSNVSCKNPIAKFLFTELAEFRTAASNVENCSLRLLWCRGNRSVWRLRSGAARNFNLSFAARAVHRHSCSSFLNGKMLTAARAGENDVHGGAIQSQSAVSRKAC